METKTGAFRRVTTDPPERSLAEQQRRVQIRRLLKVTAFLAPIMIFAIAFVYYPFIRTIISSFCKVNQMGRIGDFVGLANYKRVFAKDDFIRSLVHTLKITAINVPCTLVITISLALIANRKRALSPIYETLFCMPMAISMSAACMIFKSMFSPDLGIINHIFGTSLKWFESADTSLYTCCILTIWMGVGFDYLLFLSAIRGIPQHIMEAAKLDGAGFFTRVFRIQIPLISPTIFYVICTNTVLAMMTSAPMIIIGGQSMAMKKGASTLMFMMYNSGFSSSNYTLAAVVSIITFLLTFGFTLVSFIFEQKKVHYQ